ncbi:ABC transporter ATP-binding protein [Flavobacterium sp. SUN052]|uniref:ABC transporter ATP-binding protein n=1 Tax=Flavobacterium sp. SUN052 TaxID=3002441 RepID=UPI0023A25AA3|nr:ABC transporter ATP-binding protein [Flavobacterium sp. SUN052]
MFIPLFQIASGEKNTVASTNENSDAFLKIFSFFNLSPTINSVLILMVFFFSLKAVFRYIDVFYRVLATSYFNKQIRNNLLTSISNLKYSKFVTIDFGTIQNSVTSESLSINNAFAQYISVIQNMIFVVVYIGLSFLTNPKFSAIVVFGGWASRFLFKSLYRDSEKLSYSITKENNKLSSLVLQQVTNFKYLKSTALMKTYLSRVNKTVDTIEKEVVILGKTSAKVMSFREPIIVLFLVAAIYIQINVIGGTFNSIVVILLFFYRAFGSLMSVQQSWTAFLKYVGSVKHYIDFTTELKAEKELEAGAEFKSFNNEILINNISFCYANKIDVLSNISFTIKKNNTIAFVGKSGSGKTTLVNIVSGLLQPTSGEILIDSTNMRDFNIESFRKKIGFISQETVVFNDTIFNNVTFWSEKNEENLARFYDVIKKVDLLEFVEKSTLKEDISLGDNGVVMSGGQRQRLSIARELYKDIEILVLDEATSSLDSQTERFIQESIESLKGHITIVVIAHRLSTIKNADTIVLVNNGKIEEQANYEDLISKSVTFAKMVSLQEL